MVRFAYAVTALNQFFFGVAKWLIFCIAVLMIYEVVARYSLSAPTSWAPELATLIFGPFFLLGGPYLVHLGGHVAVDLLSERATGRWKNFLVFAGQVLALVFGVVLLRYSMPLAWQSFEYSETSYSSWNPVLWPSKSILPLAAFLLVLQSLAEIIFQFRRERAS